MLLFLRASDITIDAKLQRYARALHRHAIDCMAIYWERELAGKVETPIPASPFRYNMGYGSRWRTAVGLILFNLFALRKLWKLRKNISIVHAVDLDSGIAAYWFNRLTGTPFIFDLYDSYSDSRGFSGRLAQAIDWLEAQLIKQAQLVIIADPGRVAQHPPIPDKKRLVIENVPDLPPSELDQSLPQNKRLLIGYLGTLEPDLRGLEHACAAAVALPFAELHIAGAGALEAKIRQEAGHCDRIIYHGPLSHADGLALLARCDVMLGLYYTSSANHRFAAPNKYFEHLLLGRPLITSIGTPPGHKVMQHETGWVVEENDQALALAFREAWMDEPGRRQRAQNAVALWHSRYAGYFDEHIVGHYGNRVKTALKTGLAPCEGAGSP
ncbi:MAG: glycosyltransferase [Sphingorhabdus sp.]